MESKLKGKLPSRPFTRKQVKWARDQELLVYRTLQEERIRQQVDFLQRKHFGGWQDVFSSLDKCRGKVMLCLLGKVVIGYQAFTPYASRGSPFSPEKQVMRFTFVVVREDAQVKSRGLGIGNELLRRTLDIAWTRGYDAVYSYATAYELMVSSGFTSHGGESILAEAKYIRDFEPDQAPPLLFVIEHPEGYISPY